MEERNCSAGAFLVLKNYLSSITHNSPVPSPTFQEENFDGMVDASMSTSLQIPTVTYVCPSSSSKQIGSLTGNDLGRPS